MWSKLRSICFTFTMFIWDFRILLWTFICKTCWAWSFIVLLLRISQGQNGYYYIYLFSILYMYYFNKSLFNGSGKFFKFWNFRTFFFLFFLLFFFFFLSHNENYVLHIVIVLSMLFGAGAACGTADFMGESHNKFPCYCGGFVTIYYMNF